jgi:hypothetical protein
MNDYNELIERLDQVIACLRICMEKLEEQNELLRARLNPPYPPHMAKGD